MYGTVVPLSVVVVAIAVDGGGLDGLYDWNASLRSVGPVSELTCDWSTAGM